jgi:hypothetical protein
MRIVVRLEFGVTEPQQAALSARDSRLDVSQQRYRLLTRLLVFLLACFLRLLRFLSFFSHVALRYPKVGSMQVNLDMHKYRVHHNSKIDTSRFEEGK